MSTDRGIFVSLTAALAGLGLLMVFSASITSRPSDVEQVYLSRHLVFLLLGTGLAAVAANVRPATWARFSPLLFLATLGLLIATLVPGVGTQVNGARRWLRFGPLSLQPSELAKVALPLFLARLLTIPQSATRNPKSTILSVLLAIAVTIPLVLIEPDLGTAAFLAVGCAIALFVGGWPLRYFALAAAIVIPAGLYLVSLKPYQMQRITGFLAAWSDFEQAPYQLRQSLYSLGAGGVWGAGIGKGWQKLSFLPEANTDFVFAVVGEELGLVGTLAVVALWGGFFLFGLRMLGRAKAESKKPNADTDSPQSTFPNPHSFAAIAGFTLISQLVLQAALNAAVVTGLVPPKGIPHPFLSSGGSNLVMSLVTVGIVLSLSRPDSNSANE